MEVSPRPVPGRDPRAIDAYGPSEIAHRVQTAGVEDAGRPALATFFLAAIGGGMIGLAAAASSAAMAGSTAGYGTTRVIGGVVFGLGLVLVMTGGGELFTSNNLMTMAWVARQVRTRQLALNWLIVYVGNAVGAISIAILLVVGGAYHGGREAVAAQALALAATKSDRLFVQDVALGILGNTLVCLAVWLCFSARSTTDRILSCMLPMIALVVLSAEHVVANLHHLAAGVLLRTDPVAVAAAGLDAQSLAAVSAGGVAGNLLGVTLGNIIGGSLLVGGAYWFVYLHREGLGVGRGRPDGPANGPDDQ